MARLSILERQVGDTTFFDLSGDITFGEGNLLLRRIIRTALSENKKNITLNFENVCYVDSSGIGELISGLTVVKREGGQLKIINLTPRVNELLDICKLLTVFDICEEVDAASV